MHMLRIVTLSVSALYLASFTTLSAAQIHAEYEPANAGMRVVHLILDTEGESLNAIEGELAIRSGTSHEIRDGNSLISLWITKPMKGDTISFAGITPGGFSGSHGLLFSMVLDESDEVLFRKGLAYRSDGTGTAIALSRGERREVSGSALSDASPPESFSATLTRNDDVFDGKYVLIFATQDKGRGMDYFEVCEGLVARCTRAESPYILNNQDADFLIRIRAVDLAGNVRTSYLFTQEAQIQYGLVIFLGILIIVSAIYVLRRMRT